MCSWITSYLEQAVKRSLQDEIESLGLRYARKMREKCVQMRLSRNYQETQLEHEKEGQETWNTALSREFTVSEQPEDKHFNPSLPTEDQRHVWMATTSRHPKSTGMNSGDARRRLQEVGRGCLHFQREKRWIPGETDWVKLPAHPKRIEKSFRRPPSCDEPRVFLFGVFRVLILRFTSLCCFWRNDSRIQRRRVEVVAGLVLENVIESVREN